MKTRMVVTDLTRMGRGNICIAGYTADRRCVRPVLPGPGIPESLLFQDGRAILYPFAVVRMNLLAPLPQPPHIEDQVFDSGSLEYERDVQSREEVLSWSLFESVEAHEATLLAVTHDHELLPRFDRVVDFLDFRSEGPV